MFSESVDSIKHIQEHYRTIVFPSCIGSIDEFLSFGIAVLLDYSLNASKGKEKAPMLAFQVLVSATKNKKVLSVSNVHFGCDHDKTIARLDAAIKNLQYQANIWSSSGCLVVLQTRWI